MPAKRDKIIGYLNKYLKVDDFQDHCFNGLQIEGKESISKIVTGVSLSQKLIKEAIKKKADMIIVHHGIFLNDVPSPFYLNGLMKERIKMILCNDINLAGYHLPLDASPKIGNNASLAELLNLKKVKLFSIDDFYKDIGVVGDFEKEIYFTKLVNLVDKKLEVKSFSLPFGRKKIKKVGIICGGASDSFGVVCDLNADVFITGDIAESVVRKIEEAGINFINAGHYNTEKFGIQNLGKLAEKKFKVKAEFIDVPCEI